MASGGFTFAITTWFPQAGFNAMHT